MSARACDACGVRDVFAAYFPATLGGVERTLCMSCHVIAAQIIGERRARDAEATIREWLKE